MNNVETKNRISKEYTKIFGELSAKALGLLFFIICSDTRISAESISKFLKEGESAVASGLRELRSRGWLELKTQRTKDGTFSRTTIITPAGYEFISNALAQIGGFNSHFLNLFYNASYSSSQVSGKFVPRANNETYGVVDSHGYDSYSPTELVDKALETEEEQRIALKRMEEEKAQWVEKRERKHRAQFKARSLKPDKRTWTPTDISFEFSDRINDIWHIPPWRVTQTRFRMILADMRRRHDTNGFIECSMIDIFFETEPITKFTNGDQVMMRFFYRFKMLLKNVRERGLDLTDEERLQMEARFEERLQRDLKKLLDL
jgi:hypothetical protein